MPDIIEFKPRKPKPDPKTLNDLLTAALTASNELPVLPTGIIGFDQSQFNNLLKAMLLHKIVERRLIESSYIMCGFYVAEMLGRVIDRGPQSWYVIDYIKSGLEKNGSEQLRQGADVCFLICSAFPE